MDTVVYPHFLQISPSDTLDVLKPQWRVPPPCDATRVESGLHDGRLRLKLKRRLNLKFLIIIRVHLLRLRRLILGP